MENYKTLKNKLKMANDAYYKNASPIMSDYEFDMELKKLIEIEKQQGFADADSPTQVPGSDLKTNISSNKHNRPMLSLENTYNKDEVKDWYEKMQSGTKENNPQVIVEMKYDGGSAAIRFINGRIVKALTRGNGEVGEDITKNVSLMSEFNNISSEFSGEVRGELIITHTGFKELNKNNDYQNARNLLSGTMKLLDSSEFKKRERYIRFYAYWNENNPKGTHFENIKYLEQYGFRTPQMLLCKSYQDVLNAINTIESEKSTLEIDIDGAVMKLNETKYWPKIGSTAKFPRWAKAYKYKQESVTSKVTNITFEVGRSGKITPLAWFEPVFIDGSTIQKATLNNKDFYESMDIAIGDVVTVQKAAAIIPQIIGVQHSSDRKIVPFPNKCPCCGSTLIKHNDAQADWFCDNINCKARLVDKIVNYTHMLEIDGFAEIIVERLHTAGLLNNIQGLYELKNHKDEIAKLDRMSYNIAEKLVANIEAAKTSEFWKCLGGLGIPNVGPKMAKVLTKYFKTIDLLSSATIVKLMSIPDVAEITANGIYTWFHSPENIELISYLKSAGQCLQENVITENKNSLNGLSFCITGVLSKPREFYVNKIENFGGKVVSAVSKKTSYLVTNEPNSESKKNITAKSLNILIINEEELNKLLH